MSIATKLQNIRTVKAKLKSVIKSWLPSFSSDVIAIYPNAVNEIGMENYTELNDDFLFVDFRGVILFRYTKAEIDALTELPTAEDLPYWEVPLSFQGWNYTLAELKATHHAVVGAHYVPTDGKIHIFMKLTSRMRNDYTYLRQYFSTDGATLTWYDSSGTQKKETSYTSNSNDVLSDVTADEKYHLVVNVTGTYFSLGNTANYGNGLATFNRWICGVYGNDKLTFNATTKGYLFAFMRGFISLSRNMVNSNTDTFTYMFAGVCTPAIILPRSVTTIGTGFAYYNSPFTKFISLPPTMTTIGTNLCYNSGVLELVIPEGITTLGASCIYNSYALTKLVLPSTLTSAGAYGIYNLLLRDLYCYATNPPALTSAITSDGNLGYKIHVPAGSLSAYQTATNWSGASSYMIGDL